MAKLGAYFGLCPLIDHRSLLGISPDQENGVLIVTLGKNIAIKFKLLDQKQLFSWRTKDKFTSPIIYDNEQSQYVAVFNESFVRMWTGNEELLDKVKKLKFPQQIYTIFVCNNKSFIVFKNGAISLLSEAIEKRRELIIDSFIDENVYITDVLHASFNDHIYIGLVVQSTDSSYLHWTVFNESNQQSKVYKVSLQRDNTDLRGYVFHLDRTSVKFLSLWSDGKVFAADLKEDLHSIGDLFTAVDFICCKNYVSMISLDPNYIALYGCNSNEEGALLAVYNAQFKVMQARQSFKFFSNGARVWCIEKNLFFPVGQNLAVLPFHLDMEQLAALVGSHKIVESNPDPDVTFVHKVEHVDWGKRVEPHKDDIPKLIESKVEELTSQGLNKSMIFETLLTDLLEKKNIDMLVSTIQYFNDIPEICLVKVVKFILSLESTIFKTNPDKVEINQSFPQKMLPLEKAGILDSVLIKPFNETLILPHLRSLLTLDEVLVLLQYIHFVLSEDGHALPSLTFTETEAKLIEWSCVLLDANYQKILLTRDEKLCDILLSLKRHVKEEIDSSQDAKVVASLLEEVKKGQSLQKIIHMTGVDYFIEDFPLY